MKLRRKWVVLAALPVLLILLGLILAPWLDPPDTPEAEARRLLNKVRSSDPVNRLAMKLHIGDRRNPLYELKIARRLVALGKPAIPVLIEALNDDDPTVRTCAAYALVGIGPDAEAALKVAIRGYHVRSDYTSRALASTGKRAVPVLNECLKDPDRTVRWVAAEALGWMGPDAAPAGAALCDVLMYKDAEVRQVAETALVNMGPAVQPYLPRIIELLGHPDADVRCEGVIALGRIGIAGHGGVSALPAVIGRLEDKDNNVRRIAIMALPWFTSHSKSVVPSLMRVMGDQNPGIRKAAAEALGKIGPAAKAAVPALTQAMNDENEGVRQAAAEALKKIQQKHPTTASTQPAKGS